MTSVDEMIIVIQAFDQIALFGALIAVGLLALAAQRYFANRRRSSNQGADVVTAEDQVRTESDAK
jgi:hypothetical protein